MEEQVNEYLLRRDWAKAVEVYNQLLMNKHVSKAQVVAYLLGRSECFVELGQHEAVVADCRRVIKLLADHCEDANGLNARRRLVHALFSMRRFAEAELATREWIAQKNGPNQNLEARKLLEKLHAALCSHNQADEFPQSKTPQMDKLVLCTYCSITFADKMHLRAHCQTEDHQRMIMSDEGRDWHWRPPPRGFNTDTYTICESWMEVGSCRYGTQCIEAHGEEELVEWKERFEYRRMKLKKAYEKELYGKSYTEQLLEKWVESVSPNEIMREKLDYVKDACCSELATTVSSKNSKRDWNFEFLSNRHLHAVALLQDSHRNHFEITDISVMSPKNKTQCFHFEVANTQEWLLQSANKLTDEHLEYRVKISFQTDIYGTFRQTVVFDFGLQPVLVKHLCVDVIPTRDAEKISVIKKEIILSSAERWTSANVDILPFSSPLTSLLPSHGGTADTDWTRGLLKTYPTPQSDTFTLSHVTVMEKKLTKNNYSIRMHELLFIEEMARYEQIGRYNLTANLRIAHSYLLSPNGMASSTAKYSNSGELFALMNLGKDLSEDTSAGRLILNNCTTVLLAAAKDHQSKQNVYEALIEDKGKNVVYLRLSAETVKNLNLVPDLEFKAQIQFQLNRIPYCEWHHAIDKIGEFKLIFPETFLEPNIPWSPQRQWSNVLDTRLNLKQKEAIVAITTPLYVPLPPILIIGPFGTGKTFTLAQAIKQLIMQSDNRILICTHSNSAADLYIKDYLHPYVEAENEEARPLRIYYHKRWVATVNPVVQKYCLVDNIGGVRCFRVPTLEDILKHRIIVVTLSISIYLANMNLPRGFFTHIFLDEAAQAMECEAIMPLALANESTRIVLAGDHMQLSPELFSQFAKERKLHVSLLERLYDHYPTTFPCKILLSENYRAHEAIINFTSESFYDQKLIASGKQPKHDFYYPLTFFTTRGEDVQDKNSTAFYNNSEVYEIVERVFELKRRWPQAWGKMDEQSIGIMTPYSDQVFRIRSELRKRRMHGISVERVLNVQGKQFRAIFLSTVRTRRTCTGTKLNIDEMDFGFLSNSKLLNTAITRAQSLVAVVGDPVALCSIGRCSKLWERFLQICHENGSLFGITWSALKNQLDGVELKKTYVLNPLAPVFVPRKYQAETYIRNVEVMPHIPLMIPPPIYPGLIPPYLSSPPVDHSKIPMFYCPRNQIPPPSPMMPVRPPFWSYAPPTTIPVSILPNKPFIPPEMSVPQILAPCKSAPTQIPLNIRGNVPNNFFPKDMMRPPAGSGEQQEDKGMIQFLNNVHFPEQPKEKSVHSANCSLNDFINLLPQNMSLADMLLQPYTFQERWFMFLLESKGIEAAKKFEFLIHATTKKEHINRAQITNVANGQVSPNIPYVQQEIPELKYFDKPVNQINFDKPIYYKDLNNEAKIVDRNDPMHMQQMVETMTVMEHKSSQPLYKRQAMHGFPSNLPPNATVVLHPNAVGNNICANNYAIQQQHLQQQINADFANLSIHNRDIVDDFLKTYNRMSYANVLRAPQKNIDTCSVNNSPNSSVSEETSGGPRLYKYFS